jgi:hypothetical protein
MAGEAGLTLRQEELIRAFVRAWDASTPAPAHTPFNAAEALSDAELRIVRCLPTNLRAHEIADELFLSRNGSRVPESHVRQARRPQPSRGSRARPGAGVAGPRGLDAPLGRRPPNHAKRVTTNHARRHDPGAMPIAANAPARRFPLDGFAGWPWSPSAVDQVSLTSSSNRSPRDWLARTR